MDPHIDRYQRGSEDEEKHESSLYEIDFGETGASQPAALESSSTIESSEAQTKDQAGMKEKAQKELKNQSANRVARIEGEFERQLAGRNDAWEIVELGFSNKYEIELSKLMSKITESPGDGVIGEICRDIDQDVFSNKFIGDQASNYPEDISADFGRQFLKEAKAGCSDWSAQELEKNEKALELLVKNAQRKFFKYVSDKQLKTVIEIFREIINSNKEFNPDNAGFSDIINSIEYTIAAIRIDNKHNPNYKYAKPERQSILEKAEEILKELVMIQTIGYTRDL